LNDKLTIKWKGQDRELFMSYRRLNSCLRVLGSADNLGYMAVDPDMSENMICVMVADKAGPGHMFEVELEEDDLTADDFDAIVFWVQEHLQDFFIKRFQKAKDQAATLEPLLEALRSSQAGSPASTSESPSVGPSA
jgi:hypothetical protein